MPLGVSFAFVTPEGLAFAVLSVVPIVAFALSSRRARRVRTALGLDPHGGRSPLVTALALVGVVSLLAVALGQPVIRSRETQRVREDAEAFYVFDISRSMLAAQSADGPTRLERAQRVALRLRGRLRDVPSGVATFTDRVLPNLFPTIDEEVFTATVEQSVGVDRPTSRAMDEVTTLFAAFDTMAGDNFFGPSSERRLVIVLTDGESAPFDSSALRASLEAGTPLDFLVLTFWEDEERVWFEGRPIPNYRPSPSYASSVRQFSSATGGRAFDESALDGVVRAARDALGEGPLRTAGTELEVVPLGRWFVLASFVPLGMLLWRRNVV